jgi:DNA-binding MarR family transcriptional regulator
MSERAAAAMALSAAIRGYQREIDALDQALAERLRLNRTDLRCVDLLLEQTRSASELANAAGLSQSAMTSVLDRLERIGYARRVRDGVDRRRVLVELTPKVLALVAALMGPFATEAVAQADRYTVKDMKLITRFFVEGSVRRSEHAARIRAMPDPPVD